MDQVPGPAGAFEVRRLGAKVRYGDTLALQHTLPEKSQRDYLLLLEHTPTYTLGVHAKESNILLVPEGFEVVEADRGGDVTYHGPGQLTGYPILSLPGRNGKLAGGMADTYAYVHGLEELLIDVCADLGLPDAGRVERCTGVWIDPHGPRPRKIAAIGVRIDRGRSMHGFALNVTREVDKGFAGIVPCGITDKGVTSLQREGIDVPMKDVVDAVVRRAVERWGRGRAVERADAVWRETPEDLSAFSRGMGPGSRAVNRLQAAGVSTATSVQISQRKPDWLRVKTAMGERFTGLQQDLHALKLTTVCEEAGCPNIHECWNDGTATFMVLGERCTRACGFCLVDTSQPLPPDPDEPAHVAAAAQKMGLDFAVVTMVARDDLADGGAAHVAAVIEAVHATGTRVEVLISDLKGDDAALATMFAARPDVLNHNVETVLRLQRAVRPSASYPRSLSVLARAKRAGLTAKSGMMVGVGETEAEVHQTLRDLRAVGVDIVTIGQYLRPTSNHLPVARWWMPGEFDDLRAYGLSLGFLHVEASPLTRSSYHARSGADLAAQR